MKLTDEQIREGIEKGEITAISLDTSSFGHPGEISLEVGIPSKFSQFKHSSIKLLVTDIVKAELIKYMSKTAEEAQSSLKKSFKQISNGWLISKETCLDIQATLYARLTPKDVAVSRFDKFVEHSGALILNTHELIDTKELMERYFDLRPPFSSSKETKKNEFPDAFALLSLEKWATVANTKIITVSKDNDWSAYCAASERLILVDDQVKALSYFHAEESVAVNALQDAIRTNKLPHVISEITSHIEDYISRLDLIVDADSVYNFDVEIYNREVTGTSLNNLEDIKVLPVDTSENRIEVEISVEVQMRIETSFTFSVIDSVDRDDMPMGSNDIDDILDIDFSVLIAFERKNIELGTILDMLVEGPRILRWHAGEVGPDWLDH